MKIYSADFETTTNEPVFVWSWGLMQVYDHSKYIEGETLEEFMNTIFSLDVKRIYFHNLKFDFEFIEVWLFENGFTYEIDRKKLTNKTFTSLMSDAGQFYCATIMMNNRKVEFWDSLKVLPGKLEKIAEDFDLPVRKLNIDYTRAGENERTEEEKAYQKADCEILAYALEKLFDQQLNKMTTGSNAFNEYKIMIGKKNFSRWFPPPEYDSDIRQAYRGGFVYCNPKYKGKNIGVGIVLDVNSLYPSVMYYNDLPYGEGIFFEGKYKEDKDYNLYIQMISCQFYLKPNKLPTIQIKNTLSFCPTDYIIDSKGEYITLFLTNIDLELFFDHYEVFDITYHSGWKFKSNKNLFKNYIDKWMAVKEKASLEKNKSLRTIAKLMLNSLYGKFALNPTTRRKIPQYDNGKIIYQRLPAEIREPVYVPVGVFVTSWARYKTITSAQKVYDRFLYADTDSLHLMGTELPKELEVDEVKLGAWKIESEFTRARFLHAKCYLEEISGKLNITVAGLPEQCYPQVNFDNFFPGASYSGKLKPTHVQGGVILTETPFKIKD